MPYSKLEQVTEVDCQIKGLIPRTAQGCMYLTLRSRHESDDQQKEWKSDYLEDKSWRPAST